MYIGENNIPKTASLFAETTVADNPVFSLSPFETEGLVSVKDVYLMCNDVTEYLPAIVIMGSTKQWNRVCKAKWFKPFIEELREELELRIRSEAVKGILEEAASSKSTAFQAMKLLATKGYIPKEENVRGRPSKEEVARETKIQTKLKTEVEEEAQRLGLTLVK